MQSYWQQYPCMWSNDYGTCFLAGNHDWQRKNNDSNHHPHFESSSLLFELNQHDRVISSHVLVNTHTYVNEIITDMMSAGPFVASAEMQWKCFFWWFSSFAWQRGTLQLIAIHLITLHGILENMQIDILQTEAADFVKMYICVILKTFGHDCTWGTSTEMMCRGTR